MSDNEFDLDLATEPSSHARGAALAAAEGLRPGETLRLRLADSPELLLQAINNHLRGTLRWEIEAAPGGGFVVTLHRSEDVSPQGVIDLLLRHHQRLDGLLARALRLSEGGDAAAAAPLLTEFARELRLHIVLEDELLAPRFAGPRSPLGEDPTSAMLREHEEILQQLDLLESCLEGGAAGAAQAAPFLAILSGTLAKHEYREENNLFPRWHNALERAPAAARESLFGEIGARLGL